MIADAVLAAIKNASRGARPFAAAAKTGNKTIKTYEKVSQFWTWPEQEFLAHPVYSRDYTPLKKC